MSPQGDEVGALGHAQIEDLGGGLPFHRQPSDGKARLAEPLGRLFGRLVLLRRQRGRQEDGERGLHAGQHRAGRNEGRANMGDQDLAPEQPSDQYPLILNTGRTDYHWHTRTKTARAPELQRSAPQAWVELAPTDAERLGIVDGDLVGVESPRGRIEATARLTGIREGVVFVPFHYGYWDQHAGNRSDGRARAANELTITRWDPVSKQPIYKTAAVRVEKVADGDGNAVIPTLAAQKRVP